MAGLGTSGTLLGVGRFLKERNPQVQVWAVEPPTGETVEGLRNLDDGYIPPIFVEQKRPGAARPQDDRRPAGLDRVDAAARRTSGSSPASPRARPWRAPSSAPASIERGTIVFVCCDGGWKYLSTGAWTDDLDDVVERAKRIIYF